jgi:hypothetical protein
MRPFLPIVLQPGMQKKGSAINGVGLFLSYVLPCTTGLTVNHRPTTTLSTISRPRNIARNFGGRSENRLYIGKASIAILWTISLLFAVSNVAVFSTGPAKHRLLSTFNPLETFTRNKNGQKNQEKKRRNQYCCTIRALLFSPKQRRLETKMPRRDSIFSPTAIKPHRADKTTQNTHTTIFVTFFFTSKKKKKSEKEAAALCRRIEPGQFAFSFTSDCIDQFQ